MLTQEKWKLITNQKKSKNIDIVNSSQIPLSSLKTHSDQDRKFHTPSIGYALIWNTMKRCRYQSRKSTKIMCKYLREFKCNNLIFKQLRSSRCRFCRSFCAKINIKPLSTADFGKVMKQVFPDIRPRRLGTRGHSRYCYAAMRKATRLAPPSLPDLSTRSDYTLGLDDDEESWKVVKSWSESLLNTNFQTVDDLAAHISHNNLNSPSNSTSKQMLQKKLMQREIRERKRNNVIMKQLSTPPLSIH